MNHPIGTVAYMGGVHSVPEAFLWSLLQMMQFNAESLEGRVHYDRARVSYHSQARNTLARGMVGDWLLMLDTDHQFEPDILARLLDRMHKHDLDVVTAIYQAKEPPYVPAIYQFPPDGQPGLRPIVGWDQPLIQVQAAGAGCLLVRRSVFERIRSELGEEPFDIIHPNGEDISFFSRCSRLKIAAWCDTRIQCHHLCVQAVDITDFDPGACRGVSEAEVCGHHG